MLNHFTNLPPIGTTVLPAGQIKQQMLLTWQALLRLGTCGQTLSTRLFIIHDVAYSSSLFLYH